MKKKLSQVSGALLCLIELAVGILLLINPTGFLSIIILGLGVVLGVMGLVAGVKYFRTPAAEAAAEQGLLKGLLALGAGIFCMAKSGWLAELDLLTKAVGLVIVIVGLGKVQRVIDRIRLKKAWPVAAASAVITLAFGVILLTGAFGLDFWTFAGIALLVEAVCDIADLVFAAIKAKKVEKAPSAEASEETND